MKPTVLVLKAILADEMKMLGDIYNVIPAWDQAGRDAVLAKEGAGVSAILSTYDCEGVKADLMARLPNLRIIAQFGAGYDNIDLAAAKERKIAVTNTPNVLTDDTADLAMQLLLNAARRGVAGDRFVREGQWAKGAGFPLSTSLSGKIAGIYGMGKIGQAIARRGAAHNMKIIYCGRSQKDDIAYDYYGKLLTLAEASDFLILACSGGPETRHQVNREVLKALGPQGYLINIARGSVVKEDDLIAALEAGEIAGAGLDVFADEPDVPSALLKMDQVVLSPHVGSATRETRSLMGRLVVENLNAFFDGKPLLTPVLT